MSKIEQKIPEGWSVKKLGDIGKISMCKRIMKHETNPLQGIPFYKIGTFGGKPDSYISEELYHEYRNKYPYPQKGDILISAAGTIGRIVIFDGKDAYFQDSNIVWIANDETKALNRYLVYYYMTSPWYATTGGAISRLYNENIANAKLLLPPLPEQEKIAEILGTWDQAIEKLSGLIELKKLLKKGLMQELLTGKTRLPGFTQPWKEVKLGGIFNIKKGQGLSKEVLDDKGSNKCVLYGELYTKYPEVIKSVESKTNQKDGIFSQEGDILIPASTTTTGVDLANATALLEKDVLLGGDINILRSKNEISPIFFAYLLTHIYKFDIAKLAQGITIVHLYGEFLKNMRILIPSDISEQQAIADVLSTADDEIKLLNQKLEALKEQKKGLMQQLLTGEIRVKVS